MPISINGTGTVTGISAGGLPDGVITTNDIAAGAVTTAKITGGPAFRAYPSAATSLVLNTLTKVLFQTEEFDTNSCYDTSTSRFTPNVAGYYQVNSSVRADIANQTAMHIYLHKNGNSHSAGDFLNATTSARTSHVSALVYLNGSSDYVEVYCFSSVTGNNYADSVQTWFSGCLIRPA